MEQTDVPRGQTPSFSANHGSTCTDHYAINRWLHPMACRPTVALQPFSQVARGAFNNLNINITE
jgi:hypothetical protein